MSSIPRIRTLVLWRRAIREVALIVAGVLIALAANAAWGVREDRKREHVYVEQLRADVNQNERVLRPAIELDRSMVRGMGGLLSMLDQVHAPPRDSLRRWMQRAPVFYSDPRPRLGTVTTLIETGEIRLLRDERLRSAVVAYASKMEEEQREASRAVDVLVPAGLLMARRFRAAGLPTVAPSPDGRFRQAEQERLMAGATANWPDLRSDPQVFEALLGASVGYSKRVQSLEAMLSATIRLRGVLENEDTR